MRVNFHATLRPIAGGRTVEMEIPEHATVNDLIAAVCQRFPPMREMLLDERGELRGHVHVFVNGRDAPYLEDALQTAVATGDMIDIFPAVAGG